jgi:DNA modification methylase
MSSRTLAIQYVSAASLRLNPQNPRQHSEKQLKQLASSIRSFGFNVPVLVDDQLHVIAGHGRLLACRLLNITEVPVIRLEHLSDQQKRAFMIADNRLTENSEWDNRLLGEQLKILSEAEIDFNLEATGFEIAEIDMMIENLSPAADGDRDPADDLPETTSVQVSRLGDVWNLGKHRVLCGNALLRSDYERLMGPSRANVVFTDPPYNVQISGHASGNGSIQHKNFVMASGEMTQSEFINFLTDALSLVTDYSEQPSLHFVCMDWRHIVELLSAGQAAYTELKNMCVWVKDNAGMGSLYRSQHELVFVFKFGAGSHRNNVQLGKFGRSRTNVWNYPGVNSFARSTEEGNLLALHPTVKPVALVADALMDSSARGDLVLDPFLGAGTTLIAAERTGRIGYGMEVDPTYVDTIIRRWQRFTGQEAVQRDGRTFNQEEKGAQNVSRG